MTLNYNKTKHCHTDWSGATVSRVVQGFSPAPTGWPHEIRTNLSFFGWMQKGG